MGNTQNALARLKAMNNKPKPDNKPSPTLEDKVKAQQATQNRSVAQLVRHHATDIADKIAAVNSSLANPNNVPGGPLKSHQIEGIEFILTMWLKRNGVLLGDDMGLGKTLEALCAVLASPFETVLYLTKPGIIGKTADELNYWAKNLPHVMVVPVHPTPNKKSAETLVRTARSVPGMQTIIVTNYESLNSFQFLNEMHWNCLIVDEVHKLKGGAQARPTLMWRNTKDLVWKESKSGQIDKSLIQQAAFTDNGANGGGKILHNNVDKFLFMSGTFIVNGPNDLWSYLNIFNPWVFDSRNEFEKLVTFAADGNMDVTHLLDILTPMMVRRTISDLGAAEPFHTTVSCPHLEDQAIIYKTMKEEFLLGYPEDGLPVSQVITQLLRLRQINQYNGLIEVQHYDYDANGDRRNEYSTTIEWSGNNKINAALDLCEDLQENAERVVVFSNFNPPLDSLRNALVDKGFNVAYLTGNKKATGLYTPDGFHAYSSAELVDNWQNTVYSDGAQVFLINMASGAEGLNLQKTNRWVGGASHCIMLDRWWNDARNNQAIARIHRLDTVGAVFVHWLETPDSVDNFMKALCADKSWWTENVQDHESMRMTKDRVASLI